MTAAEVLEALNLVMEKLASVEHERWSHWQSYMHSKAVKQEDGSLILSSDLVEQWESQIKRSYSQLTEKEKQSDRDQVKRYIPIIVDALA